MTTIEQLIETINALESIAEGALELVGEYSGGDSETATALRDWLDGVMKDHHTND